MYGVTKRLLDIAAGSLALILLLPLMVPLLIALRLSGEGEVFYLQRRIGYKKAPFNIFKFATMLRDSPNMAGAEITLRDDPRLLPLGGFLRRTKVNELPQLLNVLRGEMSLVGPRPLMEVSFAMYPAAIQQIVYESIPGVTGIGSLIFRDEERLVTEAGGDPRLFYRNVVYPYKGELEEWYYRNRSLSTDLKIICLTVWQILLPRSMVVQKVFVNLPSPPVGLGIPWCYDEQANNANRA